jgi:hypothetical protein
LSIKNGKPGRFRPKCPTCGKQFALTIHPQSDRPPVVARLPNMDGASPTVPPCTTKAPTASPDILGPTTNASRTTFTATGPGKERPGLRELAATIFDRLAPAVNTQLPAGCRADAAKCVALIESLLTAGKEPQELVSTFATAFRKNPGAYVDRPDTYFSHQAAELYQQIEHQLSSGLPAGCHFKPSECKTLLKNLLLNGTSAESLIETFLTRVRDDSTSYLTSPSPRVIAETIYCQLEPQFKISLPVGCSPKRSACISAIETLLIANTQPAELISAFMKVIAASPSLYVDVPLPDYSSRDFHSSLRSSAPVSMSRSELRG